MVVDRSLWCCCIALETQGDASQGFGWAEEWIVVGSMADLFASHGVLLVKEAQSRMVNALHYLVIQRCRGAVGGSAIERE